VKGVLLFLLAIVSAAALAAPSSAGPTRTIRLAWSERATEGSRTVMTYNVRTLTIGTRAWSVDASFRNTSKTTLRLRPDFALLYGPSSANVKAMKRLNARTFRPALPTTLRPGKGWSGRMSGIGARSLKNTNVRMHFGYFAGRVLTGRAGFSWITDHVVRL
jgi:hypothetical protein